MAPLDTAALTAWVQPLRRACQQPARMGRVPLHCNGHAIGSVEEGLLESIGAPAWAAAHGATLVCAELAQVRTWQLRAADPTAALNGLAQLLRAHGRSGPWRDEQLDVWPDGTAALALADGPAAPGLQPLATIERAAVRALGIATQAVHLIGLAPDGRMWLQQRAATKATHPGCWDTLMGGMVSAGDSVATALARETLEEAGLEVGALQALRYGGCVVFAKPNGQGADGVGYMREHIHWYTATVPEGDEPVNRDGEVAQFQCLPPAQWQRWLVQGRFTPEAALILADYLQL